MSLVQQTMKSPHTIPQESTMVMIPAIVIVIGKTGYLLRLWKRVEV